MRKGIDISSHQGMIDFEQVKKAGYDFVIIKAGQGLRPMKTFRERYLPAVLAAGLDWGAYWWTDAVTVEGAKAEARAFIQEMQGLKPTFPLWLDQEYGSPHATCTSQQRTNMVKAFLDELQDAGYYAGLYCSYDWLLNWLHEEQLTAYDKWIAQYASKCSYTGAHGMWQNTVLGTQGKLGRDYFTEGAVPGVKTNCDVNICYKDYPQIIKAAGLNGWQAASKPPAQETDWKAKYMQLRRQLEALLEEGA